MTKFLKTIRFDQSDEGVFPQAAIEGEWAISGAFAYFDQAPGDMSGKEKQAFANGFLGLSSFGRSTFACVTNITEEEIKRIECDLASSLLERFGAPDLDVAKSVAGEEVAFICDLCIEPQKNTVFAVRRSFKEDGRINESFHMVRAEQGGGSGRIWSISTDDT